MSLAEKYGLSEEAFKKMVRDGILPNSVIRSNEIICFYNQKITAGVPKPEAIKCISETYDISLVYAYRIVNKFG